MPNHEDSRQEPSHPEVCLPVQTPLAGQNSTRSPHQSQPIPVSDMAPIHLKAAQGTPVAKLIVPPKEARPGENMRKEPSKIHSAHGCTRESEQGGRATPRCVRTLPYRPPNRGKVVSVRRNRNPGTSTTHERKRVCRWEAHQSLAPAGQRDAPRRIKRARPGGEAAATSSPKAVLAGELGLPS